MPPACPLHPLVIEKLRRAFGEPRTTVGDDRQWSLRPLRHTAPINLLVDGDRDQPVIWVFDPHQEQETIRSVKIMSEAELDALIDTVKLTVRS